MTFDDGIPMFKKVIFVSPLNRSLHELALSTGDENCLISDFSTRRSAIFREVVDKDFDEVRGQGLTGRFSGERRLELFLALNDFK